MALKQDEDFLRFLTMGAAGTAAVLDTLRQRHGHRTVELERYATANKIWETKIKRLRLPDLLCLDCGVRVEVRTKSKLALRMSHSETPGREWDAGLRGDDLVAFIAWHPSRGAVAEHHQLFRVDAMRATVSLAKRGQRKAPSEGAERDITWPARVPKSDGLVAAVDSTSGRVRYLPVEGRPYTYRLPEGMEAHIYVSEGQALHGGEQFLLGCVPSPDSIDCPGPTWDFVDDLASAASAERYVAVKAAGIDGVGTMVRSRLIEIAEDPTEDDRIRLEARGSLARMDPEQYTDALIDCARAKASGDRKATALAMESVFILSELGSLKAAEGLTTLAANSEIDSEIRCAALWGLGTAGIDDPTRVLAFIADPDDDVALHALACMGELDGDSVSALRNMIESGGDRHAAAAATLLMDEAGIGIPLLLEIAQRHDRAALWALAALGELPETDVRDAANGGLAPGIAAMLAPMWVRQESWLGRQRAETPLDFLRRQRIRHLG